MLIVLDNCVALKDVKGRMGVLVNFAFSACHLGISVWVVTQQYTSIMASFQENEATVMLFYTPAAKTMKNSFEDFAVELTAEEYKALIAQLKAKKYTYLVFLLRSQHGLPRIKKKQTNR